MIGTPRLRVFEVILDKFCITSSSIFIYFGHLRRNFLWDSPKRFAFGKLLVSLRIKYSVMQIFRFSSNFADFVAKKVIFVNRINPLRQFRGVWEGVGGTQCIFRSFT